MLPTFARRPAVLAAVLPLALGGIAACDDEEDTAVEEAEEAGEEELLIGETVTIEGEVEERIGPNAFTIGADSTLVYGVDNFDVEDDDVVSVTGTVREFIIADVEQEFDLDFDDDLFVDFENELAVEAQSVVIVEEG
jgi:hypothetical protein